MPPVPRGRGPSAPIFFELLHTLSGQRLDRDIISVETVMYIVFFVSDFIAPACYACRAQYCCRKYVRRSVFYLSECNHRQILAMFWQKHDSSFERYRHYKNLWGTPAGMLNTRGWEKLRFSTEIADYSEMVQGICPWLLWVTNRKS